MLVKFWLKKITTKQKTPFKIAKNKIKKQEQYVTLNIHKHLKILILQENCFFSLVY